MENPAGGAWTLRRVAAGALVSLALLALAVIGYASAGGLSGTGNYYCYYGYGYCPPTTTGPPPPPPRQPDHYLLYLYDDSLKRPAEIVTMVDQFRTLTAPVEEQFSLMNPAEKRRTGRPPEPIRNPEDHLLCYQLPNDLQPVNRTVHVSNQFTESTTLVIGRPIALCAPAAKSLTGDPGPLPTRLDHYLCYDVLDEETTRPSETLVAIDQFRSQTIRIDVARDLCNPVEKRRQGRPPEPITQPQIHFVCYRITTVNPRFSPRRVNTRTQFGTDNQLELDYLRRLCVPSSKQP